MTDPILRPARDRRAVRRAFSLPCEAISLDRYRFLGARIADVSASGLLLVADEPASLNEIVLVHLFLGDERIVAEAHVSRVLRGARRTDQGLALGLQLSRVPSRGLRSLLGRLRGTPPPVPRRRLRCDYAATVRAIRAEHLPALPC